MAVRTTGVAVNFSVGAGDAVGTAARVSVRAEAKVETASVRSASVSNSTGWVGVDLFDSHEKSNAPRISVEKRIKRVFMVCLPKDTPLMVLEVYNNRD